MRLRLNTLISLLVAVMVVLALGLALWLFNVQLRETLEEGQAARVTNLAQSVAARADVQRALGQSSPDLRASNPLQAEVDALRRQLGVDFIVVMDRRALRLTHPEPVRIGRAFSGNDEARALAGETYASRAAGSLGTSIRGFAPVIGEQGYVIGAVSVGVTLASLGDLLNERRRDVLIGVLALMLIAAFGAHLLARYIKRVLLGLEPYEITRLVEERQAMLASVREGVMAVDDRARITLVNPAAERLLASTGLGKAPLSRPIAEYLPNSGLPEVLASATEQLDREFSLNGRAILVNRAPIRHQGRVIGAIATFRDKSEVNALAEQLTGVSRYAEALRATTHEFKNKLHVLLGLAQMGDLDALRAYLHDLADHQLAPATALVEGIGEPVLAGFLLGKQSEARERGILFKVDVEHPVPAAAPEQVHGLVTIVGNLLENAFEAVAEQDERRVNLTLDYDEAMLSLHVQDTGAGIEAAVRERLFERGVSTKGERRGIGLTAVHEQVEAWGGTLAVYSEAGRGSLFEIELPYRTAAGTAEP
ncbi:histidine kinase [Stutzerimonas stutzeri]|uniref:histidine kinase n=1 Tax=Stutzerimonas stutzeri TaxID=316 RepID=W8QU40_STUST|nr:DcuS/MalK family sensor histidine kinase [Stutzerimonas stutzeri]AHL73809.1 histidine kinase [Stutzerimonas stutzeri]MCQ4328675.1 DcuS/MalK family sensor histidine kinase [Stutzerimonas stutzeri]